MDMMSMLRMRSLFDPNPINPQQPDATSIPPQPELMPGLQEIGNLGKIAPESTSQMDAGSASFGKNETKTTPPIKISANLDFEDMQGIFEAIQKMSNPQSGMQNQLQQHVVDYPIEQPHTKMQRFGAMMAGGGAGSYKTGFDALHMNQDRAIADWKNKVQPMENLATNENQDNTSNRMIASTAATTYLGDKRANTIEQNNLARQADADAKAAETNRANLARETGITARNAIARLAALGGTIQFAANGQPLIVHKDGSVSEIPRDMMTAEQLAKLKARTGSPLRPNEIAREKFDRIQQLLAIHPEWEQWLELGQNNTYRLAAVDEGWDFGQLGKIGGNGLDEATRNKIIAEIEGKVTAQASHSIDPRNAAIATIQELNNTLPKEQQVELSEANIAIAMKKLSGGK